MDLYLFDRVDKIIHFDDLSILNGKEKMSSCEKIKMSYNEAYVVQICAVSDCGETIKEIIFDSENDSLDGFCINTDIVDKFGNKGKQTVYLKKDNIQPLFFVMQAKEKIVKTTKCSVKIVTDIGVKDFKLEVSITNEQVENNGYNDLWRLSRLKWLNSTLYQDDTIVKPYIKPSFFTNGETETTTLAVLGRKIELSRCGLPSQVFSFFDEAVELESSVQKTLLKNSAEFLIDGKPLPNGKVISPVFGNKIKTLCKCENDLYVAYVNSVLFYDGLLEYSVSVNPKKDFTADDVRFKIDVDKNSADFMHGLGVRASKDADVCEKWDNSKHHDCFYVGSVNCGMRVKFKAENYIRPLVNIFYKNLPINIPTTTWDNHGKGTLNVKTKSDCVSVFASTGKFLFKKGEERKFDFELHITPLKPIDYKKAFSVRYSHNNKLKNETKEIDNACKKGMTDVIFHQGNMIMPFINYPFYETDRLKNAVDYAKEKNIGIKLYYTEREHSNHMAETFVYKALGDEIILRKKGVSHSWQKEKPQWLVENFGEDIIPGWFVKYKHGKYKNDHDISFIVKPDTRLDNYYIEGLNWLVENIGIKGIYIDDTSLDRTTLERARKVLQKVNGLIDMHMWNHEEKRAGDISCLNLYTDILPFLDSIWLGEGFIYKNYSPEYMLSEVSGIPYGLTGQMLEGGGDLYLGMIYAMNNRYGWGHKNAVQMYRVWDEFQIENSKMLGYWHSKNPARTDNENVLTTTYLKDNEALIAIYNFSNKAQRFTLHIDEKLLGFRYKSAEKINFENKFKINTDITTSKKLRRRQGLLIKIKNKI